MHLLVYALQSHTEIKFDWTQDAYNWIVEVEVV